MNWFKLCIDLLRVLGFCFAWSTLLLAEDLENQSINSGGGWTSNYENSSFTIMGETFQSAQVDLRKPNHFADLNSTVSLEMIWVEPGTFMMGSPETEEGRRGNDAEWETQHEVTLTKGFYLGKYEVTQAQYEAVMTGNTDGLSATPSEWPNNPGRPVENVSWDDVQKFLIRLNAQEAGNIPEGWAYVLPTEAQWEYACRAGTTTAYSWGDTITSDDANYNWDGDWNTGADFQQTRDVGQYSANPWGFFDMHGNVSEWTSYLYEFYSSGTVRDPSDPARGPGRVLRGGSWLNAGTTLRSAKRNVASPSNRSLITGFRVGFQQSTEPPINLNPVSELIVSENQPIGTVVGEFNATDPDGESRYEIISGLEMTWQEARDDALSRGGHLVTITSQEENNVVTNLLESAGYPDDGPFWIGMHEVDQGGSSAGQFQWVTGEAIDYTNWQASHPEYNGNTRAVYVTTINTNNLGKWYDWRDDPNSKCNGYILELPPSVSYHLVAGEGDENNSLFTLDQNGTLKTAVVLDYEAGQTLTIRVQAKDEKNATTEGNFTLSVMDDPTDNYPPDGTSWDMNVTQVEIGESVGLLYLKSNGDLLGAFQNSNGMLGSGDTLYQQAGALIAKNVQKIDVGNGSSAFLKKDGTLWGMGRNSSSTMSPTFSLGFDNDILTPVQVASDVQDFALNTGHLLFIKTDGSLWGIGDGYALGLGENIPAETATMIVPSGVFQVSTNNFHTLFVKSDGSLWGMGSGGYGKLGNGKTDNWSHQSSEKIPFQIESSGVIQASAGWHHSMFVKTDGSLWAIGANWQGRLGDGTETERSKPVQVIDSTGNVRYVSAGVSHTLFIKTDGSLWGMGDNSQGQLGDGTTENRLSPILIENTDTLSTSIRRKSFYVKADGSIWAMGQSLFRGAPAKQITPTQIPQLLSYDGRVGVSPEGFGDVVGYKNNDGTATLVPYPKAVNNSLQSPYKFSHWSGDFGTSLDSNITLAFDSNVTAHFTRDLNDSDNDSITNYDELMIYDTNPDSNDTDGDGFTDGLEISSNTDPKATSIPGDYVDQISSVKTGVEGTSIISGNSNGQVAVGGENGVEIYQIENNGSVRLVTTISPPSQASSSFAREIVLADDFILISDSHEDHMKCYVYSVSSQDSDFVLIDSVPFYSGSISPAIYGRLFAVPNNPGWNENPRTYKDLDFINIYRYEESMTISLVTSLAVPSSTEVLGDISNDPRGVLDNFSILSNDLTFHNGIVALPFYYARFKKENTTSEWMYVVRMSVDQNGILSIHEPSAPGRISSMVMDDNQLIVHHDNYETGPFVDSFRLNDGNRTTISNTPGSNEKLGYGLALEGNRAQLYSASGPLVDDAGIGSLLIANKTLSLPLPLSEASLPIAQYPTSSGKFTLTDKYFVSLDTYTSNNLYINSQSYSVIRVFPKAEALEFNRSPINLTSADVLSVSENQPIGTIVGEFNASDPDGDAITYHLVSGEGDGNNSLFTLDQNGTLKTASVFDYEASDSLTIRVQAKDESNASVEESFTVTLTDVFEDLDGDGIEDHLDDDMDGDGFTNVEELAYPSNPRDPNSTPNEPPFDLNTTAPLTIPENQPIGTLVGQFVANDPDGDPLVYTLANVMFGQFTSLITDPITEMAGNVGVPIVPENTQFFSLSDEGVLSTGFVFDFEQIQSMFVVVRASDPHGKSVHESFIVSILDVEENEPPLKLQAVGELSVLENSPVGTVVGEFNATDPDGDEITFHLVSGEGDGNNSLFSLDQNGTLKTAAVLDYEAGETLTIRVQAKDELNATVEGNFTVRLLDINANLIVPVLTQIQAIDEGIGLNLSAKTQSFFSSFDQISVQGGSDGSIIEAIEAAYNLVDTVNTIGLLIEKLQNNESFQETATALGSTNEQWDEDMISALRIGMNQFLSTLAKEVNRIANPSDDPLSYIFGFEAIIGEPVLGTNMLMAEEYNLFGVEGNGTLQLFRDEVNMTLPTAESDTFTLVNIFPIFPEELPSQGLVRGTDELNIFLDEANPEETYEFAGLASNMKHVSADFDRNFVGEDEVPGTSDDGRFILLGYEEIPLRIYQGDLVFIIGDNFSFEVELKDKDNLARIFNLDKDFNLSNIRKSLVPELTLFEIQDFSNFTHFDVTFNFPINWNRLESYKLGSVVMYENKLWESTIEDNIHNNPTVSDSVFWTELGSNYSETREDWKILSTGTEARLYYTAPDGRLFHDQWDAMDHTIGILNNSTRNYLNTGDIYNDAEELVKKVAYPVTRFEAEAVLGEGIVYFDASSQTYRLATLADGDEKVEGAFLKGSIIKNLDIDELQRGDVVQYNDSYFLTLHMLTWDEINSDAGSQIINDVDVVGDLNSTLSEGEKIFEEATGRIFMLLGKSLPTEGREMMMQAGIEQPLNKGAYIYDPVTESFYAALNNIDDANFVDLDSGNSPLVKINSFLAVQGAEWSVDKKYLKGQIVFHNGVFYECQSNGKPNIKGEYIGFDNSAEEEILANGEIYEVTVTPSDHFISSAEDAISEESLNLMQSRGDKIYNNVWLPVSKLVDHVLGFEISNPLDVTVKIESAGTDGIDAEVRVVTDINGLLSSLQIINPGRYFFPGATDEDGLTSIPEAFQFAQIVLPNGNSSEANIIWGENPNDPGPFVITGISLDESAGGIDLGLSRANAEEDFSFTLVRSEEIGFQKTGDLSSIQAIANLLHDKSDNLPPVDLNLTDLLLIFENQPIGSLVGHFNATDPDGDKLNFSLTEGDGDDDNHLFELSKLGALTTRGSFNFEEKEIQKIRVAVSDGRGGEVSKSFEVRIVDQNDFPSGLKALDPLEVMENQQSGTVVGQFTATDEDGDDLSFSFARGPGDSGNESFTLSDDGVLATAREFDFEESAKLSIRVIAADVNGGTVSESFVVKIIDQFENRAPQELNSTGVLSVAENSKIGTLVARFKAIDPDGDDLTFSLVSGEGDSDNGLFVIDENGTLTTGAVFDFEEAATRSIRVGVADPHGESISQKFTVRIIDHQNEAIILEVAEFQSGGEAGEIGRLKVLGREDLSFGLGQDQIGAMHLFVIEDDGKLLLAEDAIHSASYNLTALIFENGEPLDKQPVTVHVTVAEPEDFMDADTSDSIYHETALMIRDLAVVQRNQRNGHNPITKIENLENGLFVTTAQPHGRKFGDSVVLSGVEGLRIENVKNWNFMIDEVNNNSFRLRKFGKNEQGQYDGSFGELVSPEAGTQYQPSGSDFLLGQWTFGHLLGNMVSEQDDPVDFYRHFANQWKNEQVVNGWKSDIRRDTHRALVPNPNQVGKLTLANLPFRLLAIGNRIDLFHAGSIRKVDDAGEGRFVFTMTQPFELPDEELTIWKIHEKTFDRGNYTLIFEYGQPAGDFATLAKWAKDWHRLERNDLDSFDEEYFERLNILTDRFSKRGVNPLKPNGNPINQVRTNDFLEGIWQMREFNLVSKVQAHDVKALPERETKLKVDESLDSIDIGLWTTTTKNNPMVDSNSQQVHSNIEEPLARWINQRASHILSAEVGPRAPEWMEGPIANEPFGFTYTFKSENIRTNLARYKFSLSTCTGCHTGDTGTGFQMVVSSGHDQRAFFADFMVGNKMGGMRSVRDRVNFEEKHEFFDLKAREEIARDILTVSQQVDVARLRLTRTEIKLDGLEAPAHAFVSGGIIGDWQYDLPSGREDNDFYIINSSTGELSIRGNGQTPPFGKGRIFIRARATDGTGVVIERPYSLWILSAEESRLSQDLDSSIKAGNPPPLSTPRPNRTH